MSYDHELGTYNAEVARGIIHTDQWRQRMAIAQELWDCAEEQRMLARGAIRIGNGWLIPPQPRQSRWRRWLKIN